MPQHQLQVFFLLLVCDQIAVKCCFQLVSICYHKSAQDIAGVLPSELQVSAQGRISIDRKALGFSDISRF